MSKHEPWLSLVAIALLLVFMGATLLSNSLPCKAVAFLDAHTEYDIDTAEVERLLEENSFPCPYTLDLTIWDQEALDNVPLLSEERVPIAKWTRYSNKHHTIYAYLVDIRLEEGANHDFSVLNSLSGTEWGTWIFLHELGHMIWSGNGWDDSDMTELWCDSFANENYEYYSIIKKEEER